MPKTLQARIEALEVLETDPPPGRLPRDYWGWWLSLLKKARIHSRRHGPSADTRHWLLAVSPDEKRSRVFEQARRTAPPESRLDAGDTAS